MNSIIHMNKLFVSYPLNTLGQFSFLHLCNPFHSPTDSLLSKTTERSLFYSYQKISEKSFFVFFILHI